ncbi:MAG: PD-(D/E)XK nuclease family protein [Acidobacteriota bacterium]
MTARGASPNAMIRFLADFCRDHPLDEKIFVVPSFIAGRQIGQALAGAGEGWVNLRFLTPAALAQEIVERNGGSASRKTLGSAAQLALTDGVFRKPLAAGALEYFGRPEASPGLIRAVFRAIQDVRFAGLAGADLRPEFFLVERKGTEIALLVEGYEHALEEKGLIDTAGLLSMAVRIAAAAPSPSAWHLSPMDIPLRRLESELIKAAAGERLVLVPGDPVHGLRRPRHCWPVPQGTARGGEPGRLSWLFAPREAPAGAKTGGPDIFRALGPWNECREIIRRIQAKKRRFDEAEVLPPPGSPHPVLFHLLSVEMGLPVTLEGGIPVSFTSPGRLFFGLADWLADDFSAARLCRLLESGDLILPPGGAGTAPSGRTASRYLRNAMIGWGRDRYLDRLAALRAGLEEDLEEAGTGEDGEAGEASAERRVSLGEDIAGIGALSAGLAGLLGLIPEPDPSGGWDFGALCGAFLEALRRYGRTDSDVDAESRQTLVARLGEMSAEGPSPRLPLKEALDLLRETGASLGAGASPPRPGHLHVADCLSGGWSGRPLTFIAGLDEASFPGRGLQDPILLDEERARVSASLATAADSLRSSLFAAASILASLRGEVTLSYSSFDIIEERASFPSSVVLQAFRLGRGNADLDYTALERDLPEAAGFVPESAERACDELDWWLARLVPAGRPPGGAAAVAVNFADLASGIAAAAARTGPVLTEYEGIVDIAPVRDKVDPVAGRKAVMSATRLELLARCPFGYFLRHILGLKPPEEIEFDRSRWLDPLRRGTLIHALLCEFMTAVAAKKERVEARRHRPLMMEIAGRLIEEEKIKVPPPSETVFASERRDILESLEIFLNVEEKRGADVEPLAFEKAFEAETIDLGGGRSFRLGGFIDRLDRIGPALFRILDYKTGSSAPYESLVEFGRGRMIQHALYAVAVEQILARESPGSKPRVAESGYFFPTSKGEGREIMVRGFDRERLQRLLDTLLGLIEDGNFFAGGGAKCGFCDYAPVCAGAPDGVKAKEKALRELMEQAGGKEAKRRIEASLARFEAYEKLDEYE